MVINPAVISNQVVDANIDTAIVLIAQKNEKICSKNAIFLSIL